MSRDESNKSQSLGGEVAGFTAESLQILSSGNEVYLFGTENKMDRDVSKVLAAGKYISHFFKLGRGETNTREPKNPRISKAKANAFPTRGMQ
jgi:hypothetical protein